MSLRTTQPLEGTEPAKLLGYSHVSIDGQHSDKLTLQEVRDEDATEYTQSQKM